MLSPKRGTGRKTPKPDKNPIAAFFALGFLIGSIASGSPLGAALHPAGLEPVLYELKYSLDLRMPLRKAWTDSHLYAVRRSIDRERPRIEGIFDFKGTFVAVIQRYILADVFHSVAQLPRCERVLFGACNRVRTDDLLITNQLLSQVSY
jgi:hypothetical protein